jgi:iron complex outermembrane receptor protein
MRTAVVVLIFAWVALPQSVAQSTPEANPPDRSHVQLPRHDEQVVVTGSYGAVPLEETDRSVSAIDVDQSPSVYRNWVDVLEQDPSLDVQQRSPGTSADLSIRGSTFEETLILVNGLRLNDAQTGHNNLDIPFPFESVQRVEVLKGAGSTIYGSDAMGGVVNFITAVPETSEIRLGAGIGNWGTNQQNGALTLVRKRFSEQLTFVRELSTGFIEDRDYRNLAIASETRINTALGASDVLLGISDRPYGAAGFYGVPLDTMSWERDKGWLAAWTQPIGTQTSADFGYRRHSDEYIYVKSDPALYENNHIDIDYQAALRRFEKIGENMRVYYGVDGLREHIDSSNLGNHTRDQGGAYASFDARALRRFSFNVGVREELYTAGRQVFSPSVSGAYWVNSRVKLRASASHAFRLPDYTELYYNAPGTLGNPNLKPETSWSYEGGVQAALGRGMTAEAGVFHHRDHNVIDYALSTLAPPNTPYMAENIQNLNFTGAEVSLRWQLPRQQRIELSYTGIHGAGAPLNDTLYRYVFNFPVNEGVATWWSRLEGFDSRFRVAAVQRYQTALNQQGAYPLVEWTVGRQFQYVKPYLQLTNLTDTKYTEIAGLPMPGRGFIAGMEVRWKSK